MAAGWGSEVNIRLILFFKMKKRIDVILSLGMIQKRAKEVVEKRGVNFLCSVLDQTQRDGISQVAGPALARAQ